MGSSVVNSFCLVESLLNALKIFAKSYLLTKLSFERMKFHPNQSQNQKVMRYWLRWWKVSVRSGCCTQQLVRSGNQSRNNHTLVSRSACRFACSNASGEQSTGDDTRSTAAAQANHQKKRSRRSTTVIMVSKQFLRFERWTEHDADGNVYSSPSPAEDQRPNEQPIVVWLLTNRSWQSLSCWSGANGRCIVVKGQPEQQTTRRIERAIANRNCK